MQVACFFRGRKSLSLKNMSRLPSCHKAQSAGRSCSGNFNNLYTSINTIRLKTHTATRRETLAFVCSEHIGNSGSTMSADTLQRSLEKLSHDRTKGISLYVTKPVKSEA